MEQIQDSIWQQGYQAYEDGILLENNPHHAELDSYGYSHWEDGWKTARDEYFNNMDILRSYDEDDSGI